MSASKFKSQASSRRAVSGALTVPAGAFGSSGFGSSQGLGTDSGPSLSYVYEPPDLSGISEPNIVITLKNLQKKDGTTKAKALEELQTYITLEGVSQGGVEESVLEAWIKLYPRTSIDSSRQVRRLAHTFHGEISSSSGKRIARYMPRSVGAWLSGFHDTDKAVARAAQGAFQKVFTTEDKQKTVWRVYQEAIILYCKDAILKETIHTLSDERTTSPDDAEGKYARVAGTAFLTMASAFDILPPSELQHQKEVYTEFLQSKNVWKFATNSDTFVRKAVYRLVVSTIARNDLDVLDLDLISTYVLQKALHVDQAGSAYEYAKMLNQVSVVYPVVLTGHDKGSGKKSAAKILCQFLQKGSQGGPADFWHQISQAIKNLPPEVLGLGQGIENENASSDEMTSNFPILSAIQAGINRKDENPLNYNEAWRTYLDVAEIYANPHSALDYVEQVLRATVAPLVEYYIIPSSGSRRWAIHGYDKESVCKRAAVLLLRKSLVIFDETWQHISSSFIQELETSRAEQSEDHTKSQEAVILMAKRWYTLQATVLKDDVQSKIRPVFVVTSANELTAAIKILRLRNGKPYSAAAILDLATNLVPLCTICQSATKGQLLGFARSDLPGLLNSPSSSYLINLLSTLTAESGIEDILQKCVNHLNDSPDSEAKLGALQNLISSPWFGRKTISESLVIIVNDSVQKAMHGSEEHWPLVTAATGNRCVSHDISDEILARMTEGLSIDSAAPRALSGLNMIFNQNGEVFRSFGSSPAGATLLSKLLYIAESSDPEVSHEASELSAKIRKGLSKNGEFNSTKASIMEIVKAGIEAANKYSLSIASLAGEATQLFSEAAVDEKNHVAESLLPEATAWETVLSPILQRRPESSLAVTNPLGSAICLIEEQSSDSKTNATSISRDSNGYSSAFRMAWYVAELLTSNNILDFITPHLRSVTYQYLTLFTVLATDNLGLPQADGLWLYASSEDDVEPVNLVAIVQSMLARLLHQKFSDTALFQAVQNRLLGKTRGMSSVAYYNARCHAAISSELEQSYGNAKKIVDDKIFGAVQDASSPFTASALLFAFQDPATALRICNKLIADLTGLSFIDHPVEGLHQLILLNIIIRKLDDVDGIPQPRLVFFIKHLVSQQSGCGRAFEIITEIYKVLFVVLPPVKEIYGSFWEQIIRRIGDVWVAMKSSDAFALPCLHASLRLCAKLRALSADNSNDDLKDSWTERVRQTANGLVRLMIRQADTPDDAHQPRRMVNDVLKRQLAALSGEANHNPEDLYPVIAGEVLALQQAAYTILHKQVLELQEAKSIEAALSKEFHEKLPEELLSLVLTVPLKGESADASQNEGLPLQLRGYLLSWVLVFDHWTNASYKLQSDYVACIKDGTYLANFLDFATEFLISSRAKHVDASKLDFTADYSQIEDLPDKDAQQLVTYIYYLCLKYLPTLSKAWWRDDCPRQLQKPVELWTEKYVSLAVIRSELKTVVSWLLTQDTTNQPLTVKVSIRAHELTASYPVDEQEMSIRITLPPTYPLSPVIVESIHRVGVDEKRWRSWLLTTAGVINFSGTSGALIEGLITWRRNVSGALKGHNECAICYSIVSAERQLPNKRCGICRKLFHGSCLYKWFRSSNGSSCPLCRNNFNYG